MASEPKTRPTDVPVADFIAAVENPRRRADAEVVQAMLTEVTGLEPVMWGPSIVGYGSCRLKTGDWPIVGFSPRKAQMVMYFDLADQSELLARLGKHKTSVACLYFNSLADVDPTVLRELAERSVARTRAKYPA
ncbi:DUF1801 domain-containing protein [Brevundimonas sp. Root1279]|uniref:DUF1801 domain-containing protein n=1 Tax=Brevundimonas sp. Root1279 TaxID=1736443 RepID=UPI0006F2645F|nr:DUF1801 domain-containing protein [Brevundimonas sp. Root1279]KQW79563.1 hypothetical protein ASC65_13415 [Brevundimonas sp. Root1279]